MQQLFEAGQLNLQAVVKDLPSNAAADARSEGACECQTSLHCARADSAATGACDVHGVVGAVCMHGLPVREVFCDLRTPEQFAYYLLMLDHLVTQRQDLADVYIDFGCRLSSTWQQYHSGKRSSPEKNPFPEKC